MIYKGESMGYALAFIVSAFIYTETFPRVWLQIICWSYSNRTYQFDSPPVLMKVVERVPVFNVYMPWVFSMGYGRGGGGG